ncbi:DNA mismatch repair protein MutS [Bdellovibrio sp. qaytius]|nr:DNA mismatch repair protein MutS [Bdellovibrio sp. qaytius]
MKQFWDIKSLHLDKILLFRMGDFFEMFYDDATKAAPILGITLTQRNKKSEDQTPMCGVPHHSIGGQINKLLAAGLKIAICDQVEDPKLAKGLVKRAVTRILTPGMVYDSDTLESTQSHFITALDKSSVSFTDTTTGESFYFLVDGYAQALKLIQILPVAELVLDETVWTVTELEIIKKSLPIVTHHKVEKALLADIPASADLLRQYILSLADEKIQNVLQPFVKRETEHRLNLSTQTLRHLEIFSTYKGDEQGSLFQAINRTKTSSGARLLRQWILFPLRNKQSIEKRFDLIHFFREDMYLLKKLREILSGMGDIERRMSKIAQPQCNARDLTSLAASVDYALDALDKSQNILKSQINTEVLSDLVNEIKKTVLEDAPLTLKQGFIIQKGVSSELDELIELSTNAQSHVEKMEAQEKEATGINSLKIRYNNVFGFYIEITHLHKDKVPKHYQRKQTLANAERFCTDELIELEKKVLSAQTKRNDLEYAIFDALRSKVLNTASELLKLASYCAELDVLAGLSWLSLEESYCRPAFATSGELKLTQSRHPVVEQFQRGKFVANNIELDKNDCYLITGPNMAGKSTLMRQVALTALLAQMGSYVPATEAVLPLYDSIFTRIGASDQLSEGLSTFMVEMTETATMLKQATANSLLILDEVGRGTATFDGLCLAQSILEHILNDVKAQVFFATHYHELTSMDQVFTQVKNVHMKIHDHNGIIEFLHILNFGPAGQSYGVQVAELAGLPKSITERAKLLLHDLENKKSSVQVVEKVIEKVVEKTVPAVKATNQLSLFDKPAVDPKAEALMEELRKLSITNTSPLQALNQIAKWQDSLN